MRERQGVGPTALQGDDLTVRLMRGQGFGVLVRRCVGSHEILRLFIAGFLSLSLWLAGSAGVFADQSGVHLEQLVIVTSSGPHPFLVEVMRSETERERGLMFRRSLPENRGMLFDFETERLVEMWMKNTFVPLDMVFISRAGKGVGLAENTEPLSERIISSGAPAAGVLEINAGVAAKIGLRVGDLVRHPLFSK